MKCRERRIVNKVDQEEEAKTAQVAKDAHANANPPQPPHQASFPPDPAITILGRKVESQDAPPKAAESMEVKQAAGENNSSPPKAPDESQQNKKQEENKTPDDPADAGDKETNPPPQPNDK